MTPYTPATVEVIRAAATQGKRRGEIRNDLGWDDGMLERICARHGIVFFNSSEALPPPPITHHEIEEAVARVNEHKSSDKCYITIAVSAVARARLEYLAGPQRLSHYVAGLLRTAKVAGFPGWRSYRGDARNQYITIIVTRDERLAFLAAGNQHGCPALSPFCAAIIEQHVVNDGLTELRREAAAQ